MINDLYGHLAEKNGLVAQRRIIQEMVDYASTHFRHEEELMQRYGFTGREGHIKKHVEFTAKAQDLKKRSSEERFILGLEIMNFLRDWLHHHIMGVDRGYIQTFEEHGATDRAQQAARKPVPVR